MNKFILKQGTLVTTVILAILAWFVYRQFIVKGSPLFPFVAIVAILWVIGTVLFIVFWPRMTYSAYKRAILQHGPDGLVPVNTLYAMPVRSSSSASSASLLGTGTDSLLYIGGWLDLSEGAQVLHVPVFNKRYYSIQFTDPSTGTNFAYVGTRATGTGAGNFVISGPGWLGSIPHGMQQICSPNCFVLVVGRVFVENDSDVAVAFDLASQVVLMPLD